MKYFSFKSAIVLLTVCLALNASAQKKAGLQLRNAVIVGMMDNQDDRYSVEINLTELLTSSGIKAIPSLNLIKLGEDSRVLASDSMMNIVKAKGFDTYVLVTVRGYDKRFKASQQQADFPQALEMGSLYELYQMDVVSVSFEFKFYRDGKCVHTEMVKCGNVGSRDAVLKKLRKKVTKLLDKNWSK